MKKNTIYTYAWYWVLERIETEVAKVVEAENAGKRHPIADARLAKLYAEEAELHALILAEEKNGAQGR